MNFYQNCRKPQGLGGKIMVKMMNSGHSKLAQWGFSKISVKPDAKALDAGCGGGANVAVWLSKCTNGHVTGLDFSKVSVEESQKRNASAIAQGRCEIIQGDVSSMPFGDASFDYVSAFETIYFWPGLEKCLAEVNRILKSGGVFMICNEFDGTSSSDEKWTKIIDGMKIYDKEQICSALQEAGFVNMESYSETKKHFLCIVARKFPSRTDG